MKHVIGISSHCYQKYHSGNYGSQKWPLQDDLLAESLRGLYLEPLEGERYGGSVLRETLRAYLASGGSSSSAATMLGVSRRTIGNRISRVEELIGHPLHTVLADVDIALRLDEHGADRYELAHR